jgi:hypothetical protein
MEEVVGEEDSEALDSIELIPEDRVDEPPGGVGVTELPGTSGVIGVEAGGLTGVSVPAVVITPGAVVPGTGIGAGEGVAVATAGTGAEVVGGVPAGASGVTTGVPVTEVSMQVDTKTVVVTTGEGGS